ncbi:MAG TPA: aldehyde-activating protein [Gammaproteobacteria bacterium]|nr:aldehyde-activating protein [Gammaproteobacteria bacterium]
MKHSGRCHCGNLQYEFETALAPEALPLRACQCSFCRAHGALSTSDPKGSVAIQAQDPDLVQRYRFGLGVTDFLICRRCGVYLLAMMEFEGARYAVLSANVLDCRDRMGPPQPMDYDGEDAAGRMSRRRTRWTPVVALRGF